jgi:hypothetical protein
MTHSTGKNALVASPMSSDPRATTVAALTVADAGAAANDDAPAAAPDDRNPLWIIAFGMACFFGAAAAVMALTGS